MIQRRQSQLAVRRGSVYVLVLGLATISAVIGAGAIAVARLGTRAAVDNRDWSEASVLAASAIEAAIAKVNGDPTWRLQLVSGVSSSPRTVGRGTMRYRIVDEADNSLSLGLLGPLRVYGMGEVGRAKRCFSAVIVPEGGGTPHDALLCTAYAGSNVGFSGTTTFTGGPAASGLTATVNLLATVKGRVEALVIVPLGSVTGGIGLLELAKAMPPSSVFDLYAASATAVPYASIASGTIRRDVLSPGRNPWGSTNADGIYSISVPGGSTLTIRECRLAATLVVSLGTNAKLVISDSVNWAPGSAKAPLLIVRGPGSASVTISGGTSSLAETSSNVNYNPAHTPYLGVSDTNTTGTYPAQLRGLIHIVGAGVSTTVNDSTKIVGSLVSEGPLNLSGNASITYDPTLATDPPEGYSATYGRMAALRGTWRWEAALP